MTGNQSAVLVISYRADLRSFAKYEAGRELLGVLTEALTEFGTVHAFETYPNCPIVPQDFDGIPVSHADTSC